VGLFSLLPLVAFCAGEADSGEARLRESLRGSMLQLRNAQTDLANAQAAQATLADAKKSLEEQIALLKKGSVEDRAKAEKTTGELKKEAAEQAEQIKRLTEAEAEWKAKYEKEADTGKASEAKRLQLFSDSIALERQVADLRARNAAMYRLGKEILTRYEKLGLGEQFLAREPFIGRTRVALENLIQDYDDKLADQRAK
jgi:hypothetical protein